MSTIKAYNYLQSKVAQEDGEVASWLILAAGLCVAGFAASSSLRSLIGELVGNVESGARTGA